jgi:hypothetical protein
MHHKKILFEHFIIHKWGERLFIQPRAGIESLHGDSKNNGVGAVNFPTSKDLVITTTKFPCRKFINEPGPLLMGKLVVIRLIVYCNR